MNRYAVVMAGGGGTRFWPLSRRQMPKQLLNISGNDVMLNETIKRILEMIPPSNIYVVANRKQTRIINRLLIQEIPRENILFEPVGRNTAVCIAYAATAIAQRSRDAVMCVLPSDHHISDVDRFRQVLDHAINAAESIEKLITIGIKPAFPSTGYGYIKYNSNSGTPCSGVYEAESFIEKPSIDKAVEYVESGCYLWNSGMFVWRVSTIMANLARYLPKLYKSISGLKEIIGTDKEQSAVEKVYSGLQSISIDFGVLERSDDVFVIPGDFGWNDVGSWDALGAVIPTDENGNTVMGKHIGIGTKNTIVYSPNRLIATIGLEDLIIADTSDALLICPKNKAQEVRNIVEALKNTGMEEYI